MSEARNDRLDMGEINWVTADELIGIKVVGFWGEGDIDMVGVWV